MADFVIIERLFHHHFGIGAQIVLAARGSLLCKRVSSIVCIVVVDSLADLRRRSHVCLVSGANWHSQMVFISKDLHIICIVHLCSL